LGRPARNDPSQTRKQVLDDAKVRNHIEGKLGQGKRRFSLGRIIMAKLAQTAQTAIAICFLVMNLERLLKQLLFVFLQWLTGWNSRFVGHGRRQVVYRKDFLVA
jgi:transposase, IS5 family